jgi:hypothetical protein
LTIDFDLAIGQFSSSIILFRRSLPVSSDFSSDPLWAFKSEQCIL